MYVIVLGIFIIKLHISVSDPHFPAHVDLQKVGETIFNNEKFNILKTSTHVITDHFSEFMLRGGSESPDNPTKRVFIDKNGFRHEWSGIGEKTKSLRKTDLKQISEGFEVASANTLKSETIAMNENLNTTDTDKDSGEKIEDKENNNATDNNDSVQNVTEEVNETESKETATSTTISSSTSVSTSQLKDSSVKITVEERLRAGTNDNDKNKNNTNNADKNKEKTVMQTTFYCPYLGTITMSRFIDL